MKKPTPLKREPLLDYHDMINFVEEKYDIKVNDYNKTFKCAIDFKKQMGLNVYLSPDVSGKYVPEWQEEGYEGWTIIEGGLRNIDGKRIKATKEEYDEQFKEYYAICGEFKQWKVENNVSETYLNYWHWMIDGQFQDIHNGSTAYWNLKDILDGDNPEWVIEITRYVYDEFKEHLDKDGGLEVIVEW